MKKLTANDPETRSADIVAENLGNLKALFPEAFTVDKIDFDALRQVLGGEVDEREEKYGLNWHGKRRARQLALTPSTGTLRPCPEESVDWDTTQNLMIEGDNLEVLKLLQKSYAGKVKLIYIDPPYNTGKDFIYPDNYRDNIRNYLEVTGQTDSENRKLSSNTEASGRFHTDWLNMMYPRLRSARDLLRPDGVLFVTIDDHEVTSLRNLCDEVFGEENFLSILIWQHSVQPKGYAGTFSVHHNFVLCYQKGEDFELANLDRTEEHNKNYSNPDNDPNGPWRSGDVRNALYRPNLLYEITTPSGRTINSPTNGWRWSRTTLQSKIKSGEVVFSKDETRIIRKIYLHRLEGRTPETILFGKDVGTTRDAVGEIKRHFDGSVPFDTPKPTGLIRHLIKLSGAMDDDTVLDFFAGSGTTGEAVWLHNLINQQFLRGILVQLPEPLDPRNKDQKNAVGFCDKLGKPRTIAELAKVRLRRAAKKIKDENPMFAGDLSFRVFKLDTSNIRTWEPDGDDLEGTLLDGVDHIKPGRSEADILYELFLKLGLDLCAPIETRTIAGKSVRSIGAGRLIACLDEHIAREEVEPLALGIVEWHRQLLPVPSRQTGEPTGDATLIFRDSAFEDDVAKTNLTAILEQHGLGNVRSI